MAARAPLNQMRKARFYAFYMGWDQGDTPILYDASYSAHRPLLESAPMDFVYLLFLFVLCVATLGFLWICDRLGPRK